MTRTDILSKASEYVSRDRNTTHGEPEDNFACIAELQTAYLQARFNKSDVTLLRHDVAVLNILQKIARIVQSPECVDHWIDIAGYAACGGEIVTKRYEQSDKGKADTLMKAGWHFKEGFFLLPNLYPEREFTLDEAYKVYTQK